MSLLLPIPFWVLFNESSFKDDFGMPPGSVEAAFTAFAAESTDEAIAAKQTQSDALNQIINTSSGVIAAACEASKQAAQQGDIIYISNVDCSNTSGVIANTPVNQQSPEFKTASADYTKAVDDLATLNAPFNFNAYFQVPNQAKIDKGVIKGYKKFLKKFVLNVMINAGYYWNVPIPMPPFLIPPANVWTILISPVGAVVGVITACSTGMSMNPSIGYVTVPLPVAILDSLINKTAQDLYYFDVKPYNIAHTEYSNNMFNTIQAGGLPVESEETIQKRIDNANAQIPNEMITLNDIVSGHIQNTTATITEVDGVIYFTKTPVNKVVEAGDTINFASECFSSLNDETISIGEYITTYSGVAFLQENLNNLTKYNTSVNTDILGSYLNYASVVENIDDLQENVKSMNAIAGDKEFTDSAIDYSSIITGDKYLKDGYLACQNVTSGSVNVILNGTSISIIDSTINTYYNTYITPSHNDDIVNSLYSIKPELKNQAYVLLDEITKLSNDLSSKFSSERGNFTNRISNEGVVSYASSLVYFFDKIGKYLVIDIQEQIDLFNQQYSPENNPNNDPVPADPAVPALADVKRNIVENVDRLIIYYPDNLLSHFLQYHQKILNVDAFNLKILGVSYDVSGNPINITSYEDDTIVNPSIQLKKDMDTFNAFKNDYLSESSYANSIKNFTGSYTLNANNDKTSFFNADYGIADEQAKKLNEIDATNQSSKDAFNAEVTQTAQQSADALEIAKVQLPIVSGSVNYKQSKSIISQLCHLYDSEQKIINEKIDAQSGVIQSQIDKINKAIEVLQGSNTVEISGVIVQQNATTNVDKIINLQNQVVNLQSQFAEIPPKVDFTKLFMYMSCSKIPALQQEITNAEAQISNGGMNIPFDPFDELYNGVYAIVKNFMHHLYKYYKLVLMIYWSGFPLPLPARFNEKLLSSSSIKATAKKITIEIKNQSNSGSEPYPTLILNMISGIMMKNLSMHIIKYGQPKTYGLPLPNPLYWFGLLPFVPPFVAMPPFFIVPTPIIGQVF